MIQLIRNEVSTIKIVGFNPFQGIIINTGAHWSIVKTVTNDYGVDGFKFINNRFLLKNYYGKYDAIADRILKLKHVSFDEQLNYDIEDSKNILNTFLKEGELIQFFLAKSNISYIGKVVKVYNKSCQIRLLNTQAQWLKTYSFAIKSIRIIAFQNSYIHSLSLVINS